MSGMNVRASAMWVGSCPTSRNAVVGSGLDREGLSLLPASPPPLLSLGPPLRSSVRMPGRVAPLDQSASAFVLIFVCALKNSVAMDAVERALSQDCHFSFR